MEEYKIRDTVLCSDIPLFYYAIYPELLISSRHDIMSG